MMRVRFHSIDTYEFESTPDCCNRLYLAHMKCASLDWEIGSNHREKQIFERTLFRFGKRQGRGIEKICVSPCGSRAGSDMSEGSSLLKHRVACPRVRVLSCLTLHRHGSGESICGCLFQVVGYTIARGLPRWFDLLAAITLTTFCRVLRLPACNEFVWSVLLHTAVSFH